MINVLKRSAMLPVFAAVLYLYSSQQIHAAHLSLVPADLNPGEQYRLVFLTQGWASGSAATTPGTGIRTALSNDINDYNAWVTTYAQHEQEVADLGTNWFAIASTELVDARDNTSTNPNNDAGVPVYLMNGTRIANNNADLWDGAINTPLSFNERGYNAFGGVWTGSLADGTGAPGAELGASSGLSSKGHSANSNSSWMFDTDHPGFNAPDNNNKYYRMYAMSGVLTVQAPAVPLPASAWLFASALGAILAARQRKQR